jgi:hypothetical protein
VAGIEGEPERARPTTTSLVSSLAFASSFAHDGVARLVFARRLLVAHVVSCPSSSFKRRDSSRFIEKTSSHRATRRAREVAQARPKKIWGGDPKRARRQSGNSRREENRARKSRR